MQDSRPHYTFIIIGNGIAGTTLARQIRKRSTESILIVSEETPYFFSRTALMYIFMGHLRFEDTQPYENTFWAKNDIALLQARVTTLLPAKNSIILASGETISYSTLILATGSKPKILPNVNTQGEAIQGFYHKWDLEKLEQWAATTQQAVVVGGGLIGVELAEMLHSRKIEVHYLIRDAYFGAHLLPTEEGQMVTKHLQKHGIHLYLNDRPEQFILDDIQRVQGVKTKRGIKLHCQWVGLSIGVSPNLDGFQDSTVIINKGVVVDEYLKTNIDNIYAIGDCAEMAVPPSGRKKIEPVWYSGRAMGETLAQTLCGNPTVYDPGPWFNSAKFFDIEYQTYGQVSLQPEAEKEHHLFWQHRHKNCSLRLAYDPKTKRFLGVLALGIRLRHTHLDRWLRREKSIAFVIKHLSEVSFDPEFTTDYLKTMPFHAQWEALQKK
ncbi:MAG: NAD(P)/FAD-dependent oxidoreductase [Flavobacteriaceae bacterium]